MKMMIAMPILVLTVGCLILPVSSHGSALDHGIYRDLLTLYVRDGVVDYRGLKQEESRLDEYLRLLENTDITQLDRDETYALYVNAYNA